MEIANMSCVYDFSDYQKMYDLSEPDLSKSIFDFSAEPACFAAIAKKQGLNVKSGDASQLPHLPYKLHEFDLALCTDFIFHHQLSSKDITLIVKELCRVATEVRLYPLLDNQGKTSEALGPLMLTLQQKNYGVEVREVPYQKGNAMLRIWEQECEL